MSSAWSIKVRGVVQGVGFRPFVFRLARANTLAGWVLNGEEGVEIFVEGAEHSFDHFLEGLKRQPPPAAQIAAIEVRICAPAGLCDFTIRESSRRDRPTVRIFPIYLSATIVCANSSIQAIAAFTTLISIAPIAALATPSS